MKVWDEISSACERDELIEGTISQRVKGGLSVTIRGGVKAFLPGSQVDLRPIRNLDKLIGQTYQFKVIKFNKKRGNIVLSRRVLLEKERDEHEGARRSRPSKRAWSSRGVIKNITEYGAFVDLGGIDGLLHITDMSWGRVNHPSEVFKVGDEVTVKVLKYNAETERVSPRPEADPGRSVEPRRRGVPAGQEGPRQGHVDHRLRRVRRAGAGRRRPHPRQRDELDQEGQAPVQAPRGRPGDRVPGARGRRARPSASASVSSSSSPIRGRSSPTKYHPGDKIGGKVRSLTDYGVFIGIEEGVDGMVHKSDLSWTVKVNNPADLYHKGDDVEAIILSINHDEKKVSLGIKQLYDDPWPTIFNEFPPGQASSTTQVVSASSTTACSCASARASRGSSRRPTWSRPKAARSRWATR